MPQVQRKQVIVARWLFDQLWGLVGPRLPELMKFAQEEFKAVHEMRLFLGCFVAPQALKRNNAFVEELIDAKHTANIETWIKQRTSVIPRH